MRPPTSRNVKLWQSGEMALRWTASGMLGAERQFLPDHRLPLPHPARPRDRARPHPNYPHPDQGGCYAHPGLTCHQSPNAAKKFDGEGDIFEEGACPRRTSSSLHAPSLVKSRSVPLQEGDLDAADRVMRMAFGTFLGVPDPMMVFGDAEYVRSRFAAEPSWAFAAELDGEVVGSNFATRWGSFGFFGPLTVRVDFWDRGIAGRLMEPIMDLFDQWQVRQAGLYTFPHSPKHIGLYQRFGFGPQDLTPLMEKQVAPTTGKARVLDVLRGLR